MAPLSEKAWEARRRFYEDHCRPTTPPGKMCAHCGVWKDASEYHKRIRRQKTTGYEWISLESRCKECRKQQRSGEYARRKARDPEAVKAYRKKKYWAQKAKKDRPVMVPYGPFGEWLDEKLRYVDTLHEREGAVGGLTAVVKNQTAYSPRQARSKIRQAASKGVIDIHLVDSILTDWGEQHLLAVWYGE